MFIQTPLWVENTTKMAAKSHRLLERNVLNFGAKFVSNFYKKILALILRYFDVFTRMTHYQDEEFYVFDLFSAVNLGCLDITSG